MGNPNQLECLIELWSLTFFKRPPCLAHSNGHFAPDLGIFGDRHFHSNRLHEIKAGLRDFHQRFHTSLIFNSLQSSHNGCNTLIPYKDQPTVEFLLSCWRGSRRDRLVLFKPNLVAFEDNSLRIGMSCDLQPCVDEGWERLPRPL